MDQNVVPFRLNPKQRRKMSDFYKKQWFALHEPAVADLAKNRDLMTGETWRVLITMLGALEDSNRIRMGAVHVAEELDIGPSAAGRAISRLVNANVLIKEPTRVGYRLNPLYGYKGDPSEGLGRREDGTLVLRD